MRSNQTCRVGSRARANNANARRNIHACAIACEAGGRYLSENEKKKGKLSNEEEEEEEEEEKEEEEKEEE
jgi:hypothetical protein